MKRIGLLFLLCVSAAAQTATFTTTTTVQQSNAQRISIDLSGLTEYGTGQMYRDLFFSDGGYFNSYYNQTTYFVNTSGATTTSWPSSYGSGSYPANFYVNASYVALAASGATLGSGTITGNTASTSGAGPTFTLSPALSSVPSSGAALIVKLTATNTLMTPYNLFGNTGAGFSGTCASSGATFDTSDIQPGSQNTYQTIVLPSGCTLTMYADQTQRNATNPNTTIAATSMNSIVLNGSYIQTSGYKCGASSGTGSLTVTLQRVGGATYENHTLTPTCNSASGAGWATDSHTFTASETLPPVGNISYTFACTTGPCKLAASTVIEQSQISANTTVLRDAVFAKLQALKPSAIRIMDPSLWCSTVQDQFQNMGNRRWCSVNNYLPYKIYSPIGYSEAMAIGAALGTDIVLSVGQMNAASDYASLPGLIYSDPSYASLTAAGHKVLVEVGNEAFNAQAGGSLFSGDGSQYGAWMGPNVAAFKGGTHYNSATMKIIGDGWFASGQSGPFGWLPTTLTEAKAVAGTAGVPDCMEFAPYNFSNLATFTTAGSSVGITGEPWTGMMTEIANFDSVASPPSGFRSMLQATTWLKANYPSVCAAVYEHGNGTITTTNTSQLQLDQVSAGVGQAVAQAEHDMLMQRDAGVTGYLGDFALTEIWNGVSCSGGSCQTTPALEGPIWGIEGPGGMACGPSNLGCTAGTDRPQFIAAEMINQSLAALSTANLMSTSQSGTPQGSYAGGQAGTIAPNSSYNLVNCTAYNDGGSNWVDICFNVDPANAHTVTLAGQIPSGSVTQWQFPTTGILITEQNEGTYLGASSVPPFVMLPPKTTTSGVSYNLPAASMTILMFSTSGSSTCSTPTFSPNGGTYTSAQTVTMTDASGCSIYYTTDGSTPTSGSTLYTAPITVSTTQTVKAIGIEAGFTNSGIQTQLYTITLPQAATPTFSPGAGTYTSTQTVTISSTTPGASITYGTTPTPTTPYTGPVTISTSETLYAFATASGYTQSATGNAAYVITEPTAATPTFSPNGGSFTNSVSVTISSATGGASIYYTEDGSTPTTGSTPYTGPITVSSSLTLKAIATASGYINSAVGTSNPFLIYVPACFLVGNKSMVGPILGTCP